MRLSDEMQKEFDTSPDPMLDDAWIPRVKELEDAIQEVVDGYYMGRYLDSIRHAAKVINYPLHP